MPDMPMAGQPPVGGGSTGMGMAGADHTLGGEGGGPPGGPLSEQLALCDRLTMTSQKANSLNKRFEKLTYADCRVNWLNHLYLDFQPNKRDDYLNALLPWDLRFWGCQNDPVSDFPLVFGTPALSKGDADIVIGHYIAAAIEEFSLSEAEDTAMRGALERLSSTLVVSDSTEPSKPDCDEPGSGGAAGSAGQGGTEG